MIVNKSITYNLSIFQILWHCTHLPCWLCTLILGEFIDNLNALMSQSALLKFDFVGLHFFCVYDHHAGFEREVPKDSERDFKFIPDPRTGHRTCAIFWQAWWAPIGSCIASLGKGILQVPDTGTSQYWWILEHFWCTSIAWKCDIYVL